MGHLPFLFAVAGLALFSSGGRCQIPPAGHVISSRSEATYERSGARLSAFSNAVSVNVLAVYGPLVAPDGTTAVPGATVRAFAGGAAAFPYRLRNVGNAPDDFDLSIVYPAPCDFIPVGSRIFLDADADGVVDPGEAPVWNVGPLAPGEEVSLVVSAGVPAGLVGGEASHFALVARSIADTAACDRDNVVRIVVREEASISLALAADAVSALPGDTVGLAIGFSNPGERAATAVAIAAEIDAGGLCEGADFVPGSAVSTSGARLEYYDAAISSWTAAEPPAGRVKGVRALLDSVSAGGAGVFSYRLRVRDDRAEGWLRGRAGGSYLSGDGGAREIVSNEVFVRVGRISLIAIGPRGNPAAATGTADDRVVVSLTGRDAVCVFWHEILNGGNFDDSVSVAVVDSTALPAEWEIAFVDSTGAPLAHASRNGAVVGTVPHGSSAVVGLRLRATPEGFRRFDGRELLFSVEAASLLVAGSRDRVENALLKSDIPILSITQSIREPVAMIGDVLSFIVTVSNVADETTLDSVTVVERLCAGLEYAAGSPAPAIRGNELVWHAGTLGPREKREIVFRARVGSGQETGRLTGNAWASGVTSSGERASDGPALASVLIVEGIFTRRGIVSGGVFEDADGDGAWGAGERGVAGASVFIEDGTYAVTDAAGRYSIPGIVEGRHVVRVDPSSIPDSLVTGVAGHFGYGARGEALVDLAPSGHRRVDFPLARAAAPARAAGGDGAVSPVGPPPGVSAGTGGASDPAGANAARSGETFGAITIPSAHFAAGAAVIEGIPLPQVAALSLWIREHPGWTILIEGHTDNVPIASARFPSNLELSIARARSVFQILRMNGIPEDRMDYTGRGDREPVSSNADEAGRALNRRVEIRVVPPAGYTDGDPGLDGVLALAGSDAYAFSDSAGVCADIVRPAEGAVFYSRGEIDIDVVSPLGSDVELYVNNLPVGKDRVGLRKIDVAAGIFGTVFYGVKIEEGRNDILVVCREYGGARSTCVRHVYLAGRPHAVVPERGIVTAPADGRSRPEAVFLVSDRNGLPVRDGIFFAVTGPADLVDSLDANPQQAGVQVATSNGRVTLRLPPERDARRELVRVALGDLSAACRVEYESPLRRWFLMGYGEGALGYSSLSGAGSTHRSLERNPDGGYAEGVVALYGQGEVRAGHVLTAAINTRPVRDGMLFRRIEPEKYYPVYGDASELRFNTASRSGAFARLDHRRYTAMLGDFRTDFAKTEFTKYHRSFNGVSGEARFRQGAIRAFVTNSEQVTYQEELPGEGTSGFYFLAHYPLVEGSEKVRIEVRDRYRPERILRVDDKQVNRDYDINHTDGSILFKEPVPRFDANLDPVTIVVSYECRDAGSRNFIYGVRSSLAVADSLVFGTTAVLEDEGVENATLFGVDLTGRLAGGVRVESEFAHSEKFALGGGNAFRVRIAGERGDVLRLSAYYRDVGESFFNPSFTGGKTELGSRKLGADARWRIAPRLALGASGYRHAFQERDEEKDYADLVGRYTRGRAEGALGFASAARNDARDGDQRSHLLRAGLGLAGERTAGELQVDKIVAGGEVEEYPNRIQAKLTRRLSRRVSAALKHEYRTGSRTGTRHLTQLGLESNITENIQAYSRYQLEGAMSGERAQAVLGIKERFAISDELAATVALEKAATVSGASVDDHFTWATNAVYAPAGGDYRLRGGYELRLEPDRRKHLSELAGLRRIGERWAMLLRGDLWFADEKRESNRVKAAGLLGLSVRPGGGDALTLLSLFRSNYEERSPAHPDAIDREMLASVEADWKPARNWEIEGKIAGRRVENVFREHAAVASTFMLQTQVVRTFAGRWDASLAARAVRQRETHTTSYGGGVEIGRVVAENLWIGAGYDFGGREDADAAGNRFSRRGFHVGMRLKFNEKILSYFQGAGVSGGL
jgi:uncharacterized repeat protein (TIGR01451 family)